jgi:hypothetical protein
VLTLRVSVEAETPSHPAAAVKLPWSATTTKYFNATSCMARF